LAIPRSLGEASADVVRHLVDADGNGEDKGVVLPRCDFDTVGVPHAEPPTRNLGDLVSVALDLVLVSQDATPRPQLRRRRVAAALDYVEDSALTTMVFMILSANVCFLSSHSGQR
jgi:hypothetical protein